MRIRVATYGGLIAALSSGCAPEPLPPYGERLVIVSTDAPVPGVINRLRVDLYSEAGDWLESRDISRARPEEWPVSFGVFTKHERGVRAGWLRVRGYSEGRVRDYRGERYSPRVRQAPPFVPETIDELCGEAPILELGGTVVLRRGVAPLLRPSAPGCDPDKVAHVTAATVQIDRTDRYRFEVMSHYPSSASDIDGQLFIRRRCSDPATELACSDPPERAPAKLEVELEPGKYTLLLAGTVADPVVDSTLRAAAVADWDTVATIDDGPRLMRDGSDATPPFEPHPVTAIDRLVHLELEEGVREQLGVVLRTECLGTMAHLPSAESEALSCVDTPSELLAAADRRPEAVPKTLALAPVWTGESCPIGQSADASVVCVPGGYFFLGDPASGLSDAPVGTTPERVTLVSRFWLDRYEVTVGEFRAALGAGLSLSEADLPLNNGLALGMSFNNPERRLCTWSREPLSEAPREDYPINCINWHAAQKYCSFLGGALPSEAQWEYAASAAARPRETPYPWGGSDTEAPSCDRAVFGRSGTSNYGGSDPIGIGVSSKPGMPLPYGMQCSVAGACSESEDGVCPFGVASVSDSAQGDVTPTLGIAGLAGNLSEYARDELEPYDAPCWQGAPLLDPECTSTGVSPLRAVRGGSWAFAAAALRASERLGMREGSSMYTPFVGFRCAYSKYPGAE